MAELEFMLGDGTGVETYDDKLSLYQKNSNSFIAGAVHVVRLTRAEVKELFERLGPWLEEPSE